MLVKEAPENKTSAENPLSAEKFHGNVELYFHILLYLNSEIV